MRKYIFKSCDETITHEVYSPTLIEALGLVAGEEFDGFQLFSVENQETSK